MFYNILYEKGRQIQIMKKNEYGCTQETQQSQKKSRKLQKEIKRDKVGRTIRQRL